MSGKQGKDLLQRKIQNRLMTLRNSAGAVQEVTVPEEADEVAAAVEHRWDEIEMSLAYAEGNKIVISNDIYESKRRYVGKVIVFSKRAARKLIKLLFGWYYNPLYARQSAFNGRVLNAVALERELLHEEKRQLEEMHVALLKLTEEQNRHFDHTRAEMQKLQAQLAGTQSTVKEAQDQVDETVAKILEAIRLNGKKNADNVERINAIDEKHQSAMDEVKTQLSSIKDRIATELEESQKKAEELQRNAKELERKSKGQYEQVKNIIEKAHAENSETIARIKGDLKDLALETRGEKEAMRTYVAEVHKESRDIAEHLQKDLNEFAQETRGQQETLQKYAMEIHEENRRTADHLQNDVGNLVNESRETFAKQDKYIKTSLQQMQKQMKTIVGKMNEADEEQRKALLDLQTEYDKLELISLSHTQQLEDITNLPTNDDQFYHDFEEKFRGEFVDICNRVSGYIPLVQQHISDFALARFVDVGSGRGEWLEVLRANGAKECVGVDLNEKQNSIARSRGHVALTQDCLEYLHSLPDESIDMISGFQLIEHLPMAKLMELFEQSHRTLKKGGIILFETTNPQNLIVAANTFYQDPSHKRPLNPQLVQFMAEYTGFEQTRIIEANSHPLSEHVAIEPSNETNDKLVERVNILSWQLFGPMDYAIFGVKG